MRGKQVRYRIAAIIILVLTGAIVATVILFRPETLPNVPVVIRPEWSQFNFDAAHSGVNLETGITSSNVAGLKKFFQATLPGAADGAPVYLAGVNTASGLKNLLFVTTRPGDIVALDADTGAQVWVQHNPAGNCRIFNGTIPCYTTSSPALDPDGQFVYSYGLDGYVHKYQVGDGLEIKTGGWPELTTREGAEEKGSSALSVATAKDGNSYLYVTHAYYPVVGQKHNHGHLTTIALKDGSQHVFNTTCSNIVDVHLGSDNAAACTTTENGLWARSGVTYDPATNRIYLTTGCCTFNPAKHQWSESVLALHPDGTGNQNGDPLDSYTPGDYQQLDESTQLASSGPALLPTPPNSKVSHLAVQSGKDGRLRLLNLDNLSGSPTVGPGQVGGEVNHKVIDLPNRDKVFTALAVWVNKSDNATWTFVATVNSLLAYKLVIDANGNPDLDLMWQQNGSSTSPIVSNGVLFYAHNNEIAALDPLTGKQLWHDTQIGNIHWESPILINGVLYISDENSTLSAYALGNNKK